MRRTGFYHYGASHMPNGTRGGMVRGVSNEDTLYVPPSATEPSQ